MPAEFLTIKNIAAEIIDYYNDYLEYFKYSKTETDFDFKPTVKKLTQKMVIDKLTDSYCTKYTKVYFAIRNEKISEDADCEMVFNFLKRNKFFIKIK